MANLGDKVQLYNANGTAVNPNMWITVERTGYTQSGDNISFNFRATLSIKISTGTYYNNKISVKLQVPSSASGENWYEYEIKPTTSGTPADTYTVNSNEWIVPISAGAFNVNIYVQDMQNDGWTTGTYSFTSDMPVVVLVPVVGDLSFANITSNSATASFDITDDGNGTINGYWFDVTTDSSFQPEKVTSHKPSSPSINLTLLTRYTTYWVRSCASNEVGWSSWNTAKSFTTLAEPPKISDILSSVTFNTITASFSITDTGGASIKATKLELAAGGDFAFANVLQSKSGSSNTLSATFTNLDPSTTYLIRAYAANSDSKISGVYSDFISVVTSAYVEPTEPRNIQIKVKIGGPNEDGSLTEPVPTAEYIASWLAPSETGSNGLSGYQFQWLKKTSSSDYSGYKDTQNLKVVNSNTITTTRDDFKPTDYISFRIRSVSTYHNKSYYSEWVTADGLQLVVERFIRLFKSSGNFKYERIYISKNGGNFTELEKNQTFKTI